ncbi:hypothetical protein FOE78_12505 [Microlunatus elymi]|uniref:Putative Flp pilus-assembly TadG-like N-terminal domain-containing protein n=1 Tax=Microlunatus elymi TaxID=2596828 RepID=A0A516PZL2_9ACTN|nr:pilus assembly protein TadG-related protein [Microlunatus elymi]QDP96623.1 hypothetical protein FOE78_12505 [Microlunatus elymi]
MRDAERGSGPITAILIMGFLALVVAAGLVAVGTVARGEGSQAQTAADAAALAGAGRVLDDLPGRLTGGAFTGDDALHDRVRQPGCLNLGQVDAQQLAKSNGATLTSYCWDAFDDEVQVSVRLNHADRGRPATARATAETGFNADDCRIDGSFEAPEPPPPADDQDKSGDKGKDKGKDDDKKPDKPKPVETTLDCGFGPVTVRYDPETKQFSFTNPYQLVDQLRNLKPRLVD